MKLVDKNYFFCPPPQKKKIHDFISSKQCHFLRFHLRKRRKGGEETMKGQIVNFTLLKCYLKWTPNTNAAWVTWLKICGVELHFIYFRSCERSELWDDTILTPSDRIIQYKLLCTYRNWGKNVREKKKTNKNFRISLAMGNKTWLSFVRIVLLDSLK